jgi:pimeloyl-ACP methyl ester carboxylesterase
VTSERVVSANGVELCVQSFGDPTSPAILLIAGSGGSMLSWEEDFCGRLAAAGRFVIRYDQRDTGRSISYPPGAPGYSGRDLVEDAVGVLDALGLATAHVVGISMGGAIAQLVALDHPGRIASLTLISTSAGAGDPDLPPVAERLRAHFASPPPEPDWSDRAAVVEYVVEDARAYAGTSRPFDEEAWRELAGRDFDRSADIASSLTNHTLAEGGAGWRRRLGEIAMPALVLHGTEDPLFPFEHGVALANEIPDARLLPLEQTGHELPRDTWDVVVPAIVRVTQLG